LYIESEVLWRSKIKKKTTEKLEKKTCDVSEAGTALQLKSCTAEQLSMLEYLYQCGKKRFSLIATLHSQIMLAES
jgi:hypothetical protein